MTSDTRWRKSSKSGGDNNACIELAGTLDALRDSKNPSGPVLTVPLDGFLREVRRGRFDR